MYSKHAFQFILMIWLGIGLVGCTGQAYQQTLVAEHDFFGTQVSDLMATNTLESARVRITLDYVNTQTSLIATQSQFLKATLVGQGTEMPYLNTLQARVIQRPVEDVVAPLIEPFGLFDVPSDDDISTGVNDAESLTSATATPSAIPSPIITPAMALTESALTAVAQAPPATTIEDESVLPDFVGEVRLGRRVGGDDCVTEAMNSFPSSTQEIYISVRLEGSPANTRFISRWNSPDGNSVTFEFTPDFSVRDACIWFFLEPIDLPFIVGNWTVDLSVNNPDERDTYRFSIVDG